MKKLLLAAGVVVGLVAATGGVANAVEPELTPSPASGGPGFSYTLTLEPCVGGENVLFVVPGDNDLGTCGGAGESVTSDTFTAPAAPGVYPVFAVLFFGEDPPTGVPPECELPILTPGQLEEPCRIDAEIEVVVETTTTTTTTTTIVETTTTAPATTTTVPATTQPPAPTTTTPSPQLPATGGGFDAGAAAFAGLLVLLGAGLIVGTRSRALRPR